MMSVEDMWSILDRPSLMGVSSDIQDELREAQAELDRSLGRLHRFPGPDYNRATDRSATLN